MKTVWSQFSWLPHTIKIEEKIFDDYTLHSAYQIFQHKASLKLIRNVYKLMIENSSDLCAFHHYFYDQIREELKPMILKYNR